jgi:RNA polymerase sporulation-specific sigma factor
MLPYLLGLGLLNLVFFALHVTTKGSFPKPLTAEEEKVLLKKKEQGDKEARDKLIVHNLRLVAHIAKKYYGCSKEQEDLISIGTVGLIKGVNTFSSDKNIKLATYASRCIENEILMSLRAEKKNEREVYFHDPIDFDNEGNPLTLLDIVAKEQNIADDIDLKIKPWMGPMGNWKGICESGIGWFMIRWLVARNLVTFFCLVLTIVNIVIAIF